MTKTLTPGSLIASEASAPTIRAATAEDIASVVDLDARITGLAKLEYWQDLFSRYGGKGKNRFFLVADHQGRVAGYVIGEVRAWEFGSPPCGWIFGITVDPEIRLSGTGARLFEAICQGFRKSGVTKIRTMLARNDTLLLSFFRSQGMMAGPFVQLETDLD